MKINVDVDITPVEARTFLGLPDLTPIHEAYVDQMRRAMSEGVTPDMVKSLISNWSPLGEAGMGMWKQMFERMSGSGDK